MANTSILEEGEGKSSLSPKEERGGRGEHPSGLEKGKMLRSIREREGIKWDTRKSPPPRKGGVYFILLQSARAVGSYEKEKGEGSANFPYSISR